MYVTWVTPCAGVWIEIMCTVRIAAAILVTPCAGVWIEMDYELDKTDTAGSHSLCGSVD